MKSKIKKLITIALATTMLLGMTLTANAATSSANAATLTANAATRDYTIGVSTIMCKYCGHSSAILREFSISANGVKCSWQCTYCNMWSYTNG